MSITVIAIIAVVVYTAFILYVGLGKGYEKEDSKSAAGYFLGGGTKLLILYLTTAATCFSSWAFMGAAGSFYQNGVGFVASMMWQIIVVMLMGIFGVRFWVLSNRNHYITPADMLDDYYNSKALRTLTSITQVVFCIPHMMLQTTSIGLTFQIVSNGAIPYWVGVIYVALVVGFTVYKGGFRSQAWVGALQCVLFTIVMWVSVFLVLSLPQVGGVGNMFHYLAENTEALKYQIAPTASFTWKTYASLFFAQGLGGFLAPYVWQRMYAADSAETNRRMAGLMSPFYVFVVMFPIMLVAMAGMVLYPELENVDTIFMTVAFDHFPVWAVAVTVGILAAGMSTISAQLICASSLISVDLIKQFKPDMSTEKVSRTGKNVVLVLLVLVVALSLVRVQSIMALSNLAMSGWAQLIFPLIGIFFWKRATKEGAIAGLVVGVFLVAFFNFVVVNPFGLQSSIYGLIGNGVTFVAVSLLTKPKADPKTLEKFEVQMTK